MEPSKEKSPVLPQTGKPSGPALQDPKVIPANAAPLMPQTLEEETSFVVTRDISFPMRGSLISLTRGTVVDDMHLVESIRTACNPVPLRPLHALDLVDRG